MIIYQMIPRLWENGKFSGIGGSTFEHLYSMGVSHIWLTGVIRHSTDPSFVKGNLGSPFAISDYFDVNPYLADNPERRMEEFEALVRRIHENGFRLLIDFVPNHVARDYDPESLPLLDRCDYDWTDTLKIDYTAPGCWERMLEIVRFWASKGVDGVRCDMVELVPPEFFKWLIGSVKSEFKDFAFIGEVYRKEQYRMYVKEVGFDLLYDKSGLYDSLFDIVHNGGSVRQITWNWQSLGDIQPNMLNFLENHDELRFPTPGFGGEAGRCFAPLAVASMFNDASFMIYFGQEVGEDASGSDNFRTSIFDSGRVPVLEKTGSRFSRKFVSFLSLASSDCFRQGRNYDLCYCNLDSEGFDPDRHFAFIRHYGRDTRVVLCNFSDKPAEVRLRIPDDAFGYLRLGNRKAVFTDGFPITAAPFDAAIVKF